MEKLLDCGGCTTCCQNDAIFLHEDEGDDPSKYQTQYFRNKLILAKKDNGDCIYLDRYNGCTNYDNRPVICRTFNCIELVESLNKVNRHSRRKMIRSGIISKEIFSASKLAVIRNGK